MWLSQQTQQVPFLTWPHLDPSSDVSTLIPVTIFHGCMIFYSSEQINGINTKKRNFWTTWVKNKIEHRNFPREGGAILVPTHLSVVTFFHATAKYKNNYFEIVNKPGSPADRFRAADTSCLTERCNSSCISMQASNILCMWFMPCWSFAISALRSLIISHSCSMSACTLSSNWEILK